MDDDRNTRTAPTALARFGGAIVVLAVCFWFFQVRRAPVNLVAMRECENGYAGARTAADTSAVDARALASVPDDSAAPRTCGALRRSGRLR